MAVPEGAEWALDRSALWNAAEAAEKRKDARVAREYELALPAELDAGQRRDLVRAFAEDIRDRYGVAVDAAIHAPHDYGDGRNHHAHVMMTTRVVEADGLGAKTRQLDVRSTASVRGGGDPGELGDTGQRRAGTRPGSPSGSVIAAMPVRALEIEPTVKMGHASAAIERRAEREQIAAGEGAPRRQAARADERGNPRGAGAGGLYRARPGVAARDGRPAAGAGRTGGAQHGKLGPGRGANDAGGVADQHLATGSRRCRRWTTRPGASRRRRSSWTSRGRPSAIGSDSRNGNDSADSTGRILVSDDDSGHVPALNNTNSMTWRPIWRLCARPSP